MFNPKKFWKNSLIKEFLKSYKRLKKRNKKSKRKKRKSAEKITNNKNQKLTKKVIIFKKKNLKNLVLIKYTIIESAMVVMFNQLKEIFITV